MTREEIRDMSDADLAKAWIDICKKPDDIRDMLLISGEIRRRWLYEQGVIDDN